MLKLFSNSYFLHSGNLWHYCSPIKRTKPLNRVKNKVGWYRPSEHIVALKNTMLGYYDMYRNLPRMNLTIVMLSTDYTSILRNYTGMN